MSYSQQCSVFVGNISYGTSEAELQQFMEEAGPVKAVRLIYDQTRQQHKGYGFVEYEDEVTAQSAIDNLNGRSLGQRVIRIDRADNKKRGEQRSSSSRAARGSGQHTAVRRALDQLSDQEIWNVLRQMKILCQAKPDDARRVLLGNAQLAQALLQAQEMFMMARTPVPEVSAAHHVLQQPKQHQQQQQQQRPPSRQRQPQPLPPQQQMRRAAGANGRPDGTAPPLLRPTYPAQGNLPRPVPQAPGRGPLPPQMQGQRPPVPRPPVHMQHQPPMPGVMPPQVAQPPMPPPGMRLIPGFPTPVPESVVQQAMQLTPQQIAILQPNQRASLEKIRQAVMGAAARPPMAAYPAMQAGRGPPMPAPHGRGPPPMDPRRR